MSSLLNKGAVKSIQKGVSALKNSSSNSIAKANIQINKIEPEKSLVILTGIASWHESTSIKQVNLEEESLVISTQTLNNIYSGYIFWQVIEFY